MKDIIYLKIAIIVSLIVLLGSCKEQPNYNPFDDQFNVSVERLIQDQCDTLPVECKYYNLSMNNGRLKPYYQVYGPDFYQVVGKGFTYELDTFRVRGEWDFYSNNSLVDSILQLPIDEVEMNREFGRFGYQLISRNLDSLKIANHGNGDTLLLEMSAYPIVKTRSIVRGIGYFTTEKIVGKD